MAENQQRKYDNLQKRLMQEAKDEGLPYNPSPITKAGVKILSDNQTSGQVITLRTGAINSVHSKKQELMQYVESTNEVEVNPHPDAFKADLFGNYQANVQAREKQREEWQQELISQVKEQEAKKMESKMRKKYEEE